MSIPSPEITEVTFRIDIIVEHDGDGYYAYCPALEGLHVGGDTLDEATHNAVDAAIAYLRSLMKHGDPIPLQIVHQERIHRRPSRCAEHATHRTEQFSVALA